MEYEKFLAEKSFKELTVGFDWDMLPEKLFPFQKAIVKWALKRGRACIFADTGLGKSFMQCAWAEAVSQYNGNRVLIVTPLCVAPQTVKEAEKLGISVKYVREMDWKSTGIYITNYEMIDNFREAIDKGWFDGIVLDESSILKHQDSKTRAKMIEIAKDIPYRLSCTATPSPNDFMELGSQAEFIGVMTQPEMLAMFFTHDSGETSKWRLKGHGRSKFWEWLATWAVFIKKPSDLGFSDEGYNLPPLEIKEVRI
jgi:superfamily II DNA or RNA helicase